MGRGKFEYWLTEDGLTLLKGYARRGLNDEQIAAKMHIAPSTLYEWKKKFPEISEALKEGKDLPDIKMENALYEAGIGGNVTAMIFWLKNRLKEGQACGGRSDCRPGDGHAGSSGHH